MIVPCQIIFRNVAPSEAITNHIRQKIVKLESFYGRILSCRVMLAMPHHHKSRAYQVHIDLTVPGGEIVVHRAHKFLVPGKLETPQQAERNLLETQERAKLPAHADIYVAIRDAFDAAGRKLQDHARRQSGAVKLRRPAAAAPLRSR